MTEKWRSDPASKRQKQKLRFFKIKYSKDISKGDASDLIDEIDDPEREDAYRDWRDEQDAIEEEKEFENERIEFLRDDPDWLELNEMRKPSKKVTKEIMLLLDTQNPKWEEEDRSIFYTTVLERYPEFKKQPKTRSTKNKKEKKSSILGCLGWIVLVLIGFSILMSIIGGNQK